MMKYVIAAAAGGAVGYFAADKLIEATGRDGSLRMLRGPFGDKASVVVLGATTASAGLLAAKVL